MIIGVHMYNLNLIRHLGYFDARRGICSPGAKEPGATRRGCRPPICHASFRLRYTIRMDRLLTTIPAHYDGTTIQLDVPVALEPNARLLVTILDPAEAAPDLVYAIMSASSASLARIWDNDEDAVYDTY